MFFSDSVATIRSWVFILAAEMMKLLGSSSRRDIRTAWGRKSPSSKTWTMLCPAWSRSTSFTPYFSASRV